MIYLVCSPNLETDRFRPHSQAGTVANIMARTRTSTASGSAPVRTSGQRPQRATLARRSKPKSLHIDDSDDATDSHDADGSDLSLESDDDASDDDVDSGVDRAIDDLDIQPARRKAPNTTKNAPRRRPASRRNVKKSTRNQSKSTPRGVKRRHAQTDHSARTPTKRAKTTSKHASPAPDPGIIPDWRDPAIPYSAWVDTFYYAATAGGTLDTSWLLHAATTCKSFVEPALTALYQCPSPATTAKARKLATLLEQPASDTLFNYRAKIESIYINIDNFPLNHLSQVVRSLYRLKELIIFSSLDQPPYRNLDKTIRWHYPEELFRALSAPVDATGAETNPIILKSWEWSSRLLGSHVADEGSISAIHQLPSFVHLTKLSFTNFQVPSLHKAEAKDEAGALQIYEEDGRVIEAIADSISQLDSLRHLVFESSTVMNDRLLPLLPKTLSHLELVNCWEVNSEDLAQFLRTHGYNMASLTLLHNQSLDLAFLTDLAETCPGLRELRMNLSYFRHHDSVSDADPMYDQALLPDQLPLWPSSLRVIEIEHIRQWSVEAAEMFLQSLVDSAPNLPNLRHLAIKTMLNIPWQRRAELRRVWSEKLDHVFLRPWEPPMAVTTLRPQEGGPDTAVVTPTKKRKRAQPSPPSRRSGRIAAHASDSDRRSSRSLRHSNRPLYRDPDTDEDEPDSSEEEHTGSHNPNDGERSKEDVEQQLPVQGMCETVSIMFDNQKVRELQYGMEDFNDDDGDSSGEEWQRDEEEEDDHVFVWR